MLIDIHAHLCDPKYADFTDSVVSECLEKDVKIIVDSAYSYDTSLMVFNNSKKFESVYFVVGIHPEKWQEYNQDSEKLFRELSADEKCLAIGEIGLDYHYAGFDKDGQKQAFLSQIELANSLGLPFVVHSRDASSDVFDLLNSNKSMIKHGFLMHCYSESKEMAHKYLDLGAYFSFGGVITFKNAKKEEIIKSIPLDRLLTETDSPYLTPVPYRGEVNSPKYIEFVYEKLSQVLLIPRDNLENQIKNNAQALFKKLKV